MADFAIKDNSPDVIDAKKNAIERALWAIGAVIETDAKQNLADFPRVDTGRLMNSVTHATGERHSSATAPASGSDGAPEAEPEDGTVYIGTNVEYAQAVEYGTSRMKAAHYLKRAADGQKGNFKAMIEESLRNA